MKKFLVSILTVALSASVLFAQENTLEQATKMYNEGATSLQTGDKATALQYFEQALQMGTALGDQGKDVVANCKNAIPTISLSIAKDLVKEANYDEAITKLNEVKAIAEKYEAFEVVTEATDLIPQVLMQKGGKLFNEKAFAQAADAYREVLVLNPTNGMAALRLGQALGNTGDVEAAKEAYLKAAENGQEKSAKAQISKLYLKQAAVSLKAKKYSDAVTLALTSNEYLETPQGWQVAAQASQIAGKNADAIKYFEKYVEVAPTAKNIGQICYTLGALYQQSGNVAKAKEYYNKALSDPKYGAEAKKILDVLK